MILERLELLAFGPFTHRTLTLGPGLHLIHGPNEAGKSTTLRAVGNLLFGIPHNSPDDHRHSYAKLRIGALLHTPGLPSLAVVRRKGRDNVLLNPADNTPLDPRLLEEHLDGLTQELFDTLFGLDHRRLHEGGNALLQGHGELAQSLFAAGAGLVHLRQRMEDLKAEADGIYLPRGKKQSLHLAEVAYREALKTIQEQERLSGAWQEASQALARLEAERTAIGQRLARQRAALRGGERQLYAHPLALRRVHLLAALAPLAGTPLLPADAPARRLEAQIQQQRRQEERQRLLGEQQALQEQLAQLPDRSSLLDRQGEIEWCHQELGNWRRLSQELPALRNERDQGRKNAQRQWHELLPGTPFTPERREQHHPGATALESIRSLARRHPALAAEQLRTEEQHHASQQRLGRITTELAALPPTRDTAPLERALKACQRLGDTAEQREQLERRQQQLRHTADSALAALGLWRGSLEQVAALPLPGGETISRFQQQLDALAHETAELRRALSEGEGRIQERRQQLHRHRLQGELPSEADLAHARRRREGLWRAVAEAWQGGIAPAEAHAPAGGIENNPAEETSPPSPSPAPLLHAYPEAVSRADQLADRLRREAERVAEHAALVAELARLEQQQEGQSAALAEAQHALAEGRAQWRQLWQPWELEPLPPREMREWREGVTAIRRTLEQLAEVTHEAARLEQRIAQQRAALLAVWPGDAPAPAAESPLTELDRQGWALVAAVKEAASRHQHLTRDREEATEAAARADQQGRRCAAELAAWQEHWQHALDPLGLPPDTPPEVALALLERWEALARTLAEQQRVEARISGLEEQQRTFLETLGRLVTALLPDASGSPPEEQSAQLSRQLRQAHREREEKQRLEQAMEEKSRALEAGSAALEEANATLAALLAQGGCDTLEALEAVERRSADKARLQQALAEVEEQLAVQGEGTPLEAFCRQVAALDPDTLRQTLEENAREIQQLEEAHARLSQEVGRQQEITRRVDGGPAAARAAQEAQERLEEMRHLGERHLRAKLGAMLLHHTLERYRERHQGPLLHRAGALFATLTGGSFSGLTTDYGPEDQPVVKGVRPDGALVEMAGMSDGSRDQLYLALRLAAIEQHCHSAHPMPVVLDDLLVNFDDQRAGAALRTLHALSATTQVLFFTHHRHLLAVAGEHLPREGYRVHRLEENAGGGEGAPPVA